MKPKYKTANDRKSEENAAEFVFAQRLKIDAMRTEHMTHRLKAVPREHFGHGRYLRVVHDFADDLLKSAELNNSNGNGPQKILTELEIFLLGHGHDLSPKIPMPAMDDAFAGAADGFRRRLLNAEALQQHIKTAFHFADDARAVGDHQKVVDIGDDLIDAERDVDAVRVHKRSANDDFVKDVANELHKALADSGR